MRVTANIFKVFLGYSDETPSILLRYEEGRIPPPLAAPAIILLRLAHVSLFREFTVVFV